MSGWHSGVRLAWIVGLVAGLGACALSPSAPSSAHVVVPSAEGIVQFSPQQTARWEPVLVPGKLRTAFKLETRDQRSALQADAEASASMLRQRVRVPPEQLGRLRFQWQIDNLMANADMAERDSEDSPVRLILAFEGDRSRFSAKNAMLSDLTEALTGEPLPYATLMYVWCNHRPVDSVILNPRTDRVRKWVVESGPTHIRQWREYQRDVRADFEKAFGEPPGALVGIAIMTDSDNTRSRARAWYGDIRLD
jgi:hypothetical protein